eukprot:315290-Chlamydomonas_euryale.AAC.1
MHRIHPYMHASIQVNMSLVWTGTWLMHARSAQGETTVKAKPHPSGRLPATHTLLVPVQDDVSSDVLLGDEGHALFAATPWGLDAASSWDARSSYDEPAET